MALALEASAWWAIKVEEVRLRATAGNRLYSLALKILTGSDK